MRERNNRFLSVERRSINQQLPALKNPVVKYSTRLTPPERLQHLKIMNSVTGILAVIAILVINSQLISAGDPILIGKQPELNN